MDGKNIRVFDTMKLTNKIAIGCLVQWYEIEIIDEYIQSIRNALDLVDNKENIVLDFVLVTNQDLEKINNEITMEEIETKFMSFLPVGTVIKYKITDKLYTIADYRRDFNEKYCDMVDVLMWGESDSLIPRQTFQILDNLHNGVKETTPKYVGFFATCKMWDKSWEILEHPEFTVKPFKDIGNRVETKDWWSLRYNMNIDEMNSFNDKVEDLDIRTTNQLKFNGCGLVISSDVIKSGINIPKGSFFIHEDTAFMNNCLIMFQGRLPQYIIKNILLVHNRKHIKKRCYILGEEDVSAGDVGGARKAHSWYTKANQLSEHNAHNMFNQNKVYCWEDIF